MTLFPLKTSFPAAVLWDMDGTLVDTEPYWMQAETELVESFGGVWTHADGMLMVGSGLTNSARILQSRGVDLGADDIVGKLTDRVQEQLRDHGVPWRPGARELLRLVKDAGIPMGLVTMSIDRMARQVSDLIGFEAFDTIVTGDMVTDSKPHPEAYLAAAGALGVDVVHCLAVEDSVPGVASAVAAGTVTIGVPHMIPLAQSPLYDLWPTLAGQSVHDLHSVYSLRRPVSTSPSKDTTTA